MEITSTNLAAGIAFRCKKWSSSKAIIDDTIATKLSGKGAMYFKCNQYDCLRRLQGSYMPPEEIMDKLDLMEFIYSNSGEKYDKVRFEIQVPQEASSATIHLYSTPAEDADGKRVMNVVTAVWDEQKETLSNNQLMLRFKMGYDVANRVLARLEEFGIVMELEAEAKDETMRVQMQEERNPADVVPKPELINQWGLDPAKSPKRYRRSHKAPADKNDA